MINSRISQKKFIIIILSTVIIYSLFFVFSDLQLLYEKILIFNPLFIPLILIIIFSSWLILFLRWELLLKNSNIKIPLKHSFLIYLSGFSLNVTPLKSGELIKSIILDNKFNIKKTYSVPVILSERFFDIVGTVIVATLGISFLGPDFIPILLITFGIISLIFSIVVSKKIFNFLLNVFKKINLFSKLAIPLENSYENIRKSANPKIFGLSTVLTISFRFVESIGIYIVFLGFGINLFDFFILLGSYSISVIFGSISMSPAGIGITEGSLASLFSFHGIELSSALILVIIIRFFTLWYSVIIGFIALKLSNGLNKKN